MQITVSNIFAYLDLNSSSDSVLAGKLSAGGILKALLKVVSD